MEFLFSTLPEAELTAALPQLGGDSSIRAFMGWNGLAIGDEFIDVVDMAREYADRAREESCGQCFPCRMGSVEIASILERICEGKGESGDLARLESLAVYIRESSRCDIGQTFPVPILDALRKFRERFEEAVSVGRPRGKGVYACRITAPCVSACPARVDVPRYVELVRDDKWQESLELVRETCPLPGTIGRVCVRFCELKCRRGALDEPISIKALKRFVADRGLEGESANAVKEKPLHKERVAIVGAGPAGLSCAYYLGLTGYSTTVFEMLNEPGGMAAVGIPDYRLPRAILRGEAAKAESVGAEIRYGVKVGEDVTIPSLFEEGYRAVFVASGAPGASSMGCEGEDEGYAGFMSGVDFLREIALGAKPLEGRKMLVIGGGNVAMDCVRSALRQGFDDVNLLYRRTEKEMPADKVEIDESKEEGVKFHTLVAPVRIHAENGKVTGLECVRMTLGEPDASGRRKPVPEEGSNFMIVCDAIVPAIGQACNVGEIVPEGVRVARNSTLMVDSTTLVSNDPRIFGGGDCVTGPATLVAALAAGRRAAASISEFLETGSCAKTPEDWLDELTASLGKAHGEEAPPFAGHRHREHPKVVDPAVRIRSFDEVEGCLTASQARREAKRCLRCYRITLAAVA